MPENEIEIRNQPRPVVFETMLAREAAMVRSDWEEEHRWSLFMLCLPTPTLDDSLLPYHRRRRRACVHSFVLFPD
jgi:hypothetical protein